jgi:hypothetical protein
VARRLTSAAARWSSVGRLSAVVALSGPGDAKQQSSFGRTAARLTQERDMKILVMLAAVIVSTSLVLPTVAQAAALI